MTFPIRMSTVDQEGISRSSKWLKHAVLLNEEEIHSFFSVLETCFLVPATGLVSKDSWQVTLDEFFNQYKTYLKWMESEPLLPPPPLRRFFSLMLSVSLEAFYAVAVSADKLAIKAALPVIQIQMYHCFFSSFDHKLRPMVMSPDSFAWGIQIAYPQVYEDPKTHQHAKTLLDPKFLNSQPFKEMVSWLRKNTQPVPLQDKEGKVYAPFRIGKASFNQRETHCGLQNILSQGVKICGT
jgi:hypothetical protein